jgi:adenosine deaminase
MADLASAYLARARAQNIRHAEIFFDPQAHTRRGVPLAAIVEGIGAALDEASRSNGPTTRLIACFLRDLDAADAIRTLDSLLPWRARIVGVGLDSAEANNPPAKFAETFSRARGLGLPRQRIELLLWTQFACRQQLPFRFMCMNSFKHLF